MVRTWDWVSTRFRNPRGRGENDATVYWGGAEVTTVSFSSRLQGFLNQGETRSSCLTVLEPTTPTDGVGLRVVRDKLNLRLQEWFCLVFWQVCKTLFPVGFARHNSSLELGMTGKAKLALKRLSSRMILSWKPHSNLTPKEPSARTTPWIAAWMMLKWMSCCWWPARSWNQLQRRPNLEQARIVSHPL